MKSKNRYRLSGQAAAVEKPFAPARHEFRQMKLQVHERRAANNGMQRTALRGAADAER
jgi:hypothetical protein